MNYTKTMHSKEIENMSNIIKYQNGEISIDVNFDYEKETIWLTQTQIAELFEVDRTRITRHINNILQDGELDASSCAENAQVQKEGKREVLRRINYYNLDMIISIGYRVNSKRGIEFGKWASNILKEYMFKGYAVNQRRLKALNKTIEIQNRMLASTMDISTHELSSVINEYTRALELLDNYDHQVMNEVIEFEYGGKDNKWELYLYHKNKKFLINATTKIASAINSINDSVWKVITEK